MGLGEIFRKTSFLKPLSARVIQTPEQKAKTKELKVLDTRNDIELKKLENEKKLWAVK